MIPTRGDGLTSGLPQRRPSTTASWPPIGALLPLLVSVLIALLTSTASLAAQVNIGGVVLDALTNRPIPGARVSIAQTNQGALTQQSGRFLLLNVTEATVTLEITALGYLNRTVEVARGTLELAIRLEPAAMELDAIVVTGTAGAEQARALGNAVGRVDAGKLTEVSPLSHVESLITGSVPGVSVQAAGGEIGSGANIRIRGASSITLSSQPLLYIDGVRANGDNADTGGGITPGRFFATGVDNRTPPSRLNDINPEDIASIEIIKGPAAATLYGTEASNGVINIITKRGQQGAPRFTMTVKQGGNWLPNPEEYFPSTYFTCQGTSASCTPGEVVEFNVLREDRIRNGNTWFQTGQTKGYAGSVSGGSDDLLYYFSGDWDRDEGIVDYNWQNQLRARANLSWTPRDDLDVSFRLSGIRSVLKSASASQPITTAIIWSCFGGCEEGSGALSAVDGVTRGYTLYLPEVLADSVEGFQRVNRTTYTLKGTHRPTDWLTHRLALGADWTETKSSSLYRPIKGPGHFFPQGFKAAQQRTTQVLTLDYSAGATVAPSEGITLGTTVGVQYYARRRDWIYAEGETFAVPQLELISAGALKSAEEGFVENKTIGAFVQGQISLHDRLYFTVAARGDDNSSFGRDFDFILYPKVSASWVLSEESFVEPIDWIGELRIRAAWGRAGQQPDAFAALRTYEPAVGASGVAALQPGNIGNPDLEPEVGEELEVGFDAGLFNERIGLQFTYYDQLRKRAIIAVPVKPSVGFPGTQFRNIGEITNAGVEVGLSARLVRSAHWNLEMTLSLSTNTNNISSMGGITPQILDTGFKWQGQYFAEGFPLGAIFLPRVVSADIQGSGSGATAINVMCEGGTSIPDTPNLSRGGGSPVPCAQAPAIYAGTPVPSREVSASWTLTLFDDLQLFAQIDYLGGHQMVIGDAETGHMDLIVTRASQERTDPILLGYSTLGSLNAAGSRTGLIDASFAKLRRVAATWTVPDRLTSQIGAERLSLTLAAQNMWTIWQAAHDVFGYPIRDPEGRNTNGIASDPGGLYAASQEGWPMTKRLLLSARVTF